MQAYEAVKDVILRIVDEILKGTGAGAADKLPKEEKTSLLKDVQQKAEEAFGQLDEHNRWHIYTTGHSMGGALATLCAHELAVSCISSTQCFSVARPGYCSETRRKVSSALQCVAMIKNP